MQIAVLGIDLGKNSCSVVGLDASGRVVLRRRLHRDGVIRLAAGLPRCAMAMEACCGAQRRPPILNEPNGTGLSATPAQSAPARAASPASAGSGRARRAPARRARMGAR